MKKIKFDPTGYRIFVKKDTNEYYAIRTDEIPKDKKWEDFNCDLEFIFIDNNGFLTAAYRSINTNDVSEVWIWL